MDSGSCKLPTDELVNRTRAANKFLGLGIGDETFQRLLDTAPGLPDDPHTFVSLRLRLGHGSDGVAETFDAHTKYLQHLFGGPERFWQWELLKSGKDRLRLLNGDTTHVPTLSWNMLDMNMHRDRKSIEVVRGRHSIADEGLVFAWLYPEYVRLIDCTKYPAYFLAGYEMNVPEATITKSWTHIPMVIPCGEDRVDLYYDALDFEDKHFSVPEQI